jgi:hypothetical protein
VEVKRTDALLSITVEMPSILYIDGDHRHFLTSYIAFAKVRRTLSQSGAYAGKVLVRKSPWLLLLFILLGGLLGGILGEILRVMAPKGTIQNIFTTALTPGINPPVTLDLVLLKLTFGVVLKMNLLSFLGMFLGIYLYKQA